MSYGGTHGKSARDGGSKTVPGPHALTRVAADGGRDFPYDANGNMTNIDGLTCGWDFKDRMVTAENDKMSAQYHYDYTDRRVIKQITPKSSVDPELLTSNFQPKTTLYINKYYEIRPGEPPVKYVWSGSTRVARVTAVLKPTLTKTQHLRLNKGWNLCTITVGGAQAQLNPATNEKLTAAVWWDGETSGWQEITAAPLPVNVAVWLMATEDTLLSLTGTCGPPTDEIIPAQSGRFVRNTRDAPIDLSSLPPETQLWQWNRPNQTWNTNLPAVPDFVSQATLQNLPEGTALFLRSEETPVQITQTDDPVLKIRYYHQDHLGSSSVISDESGELVEEITNYPFGYLRNTYRPRGLAEAYGFSEKEQDAESDLHYFEARYLLAQNGRFSSVDWAAHAVLREGIVTPQLLNSYAYVSNSPLVYEDPDGNFLNFVVGGIIGVAAEATGQIVGSMMEGKSFSDAVDNIDYRQVVVAGAIGALTGGASAMAGNALKLGAKIAVQASIEITGQVVESIGKQMVVNGSMDIRKVDPLKTISDVSIGLLSAGVSTRVGEIGSGLLRNKITKNAMSNVSDPLSINGAAVVKKTVQSFEGLIRASGDLGQGTTAVLSSAVNAVNTELNQKPSEDKFK